MRPADLVLDEPAAEGAVELPELDRVADEALRVADERVSGLDRPIDPERVRLVVHGWLNIGAADELVKRGLAASESSHPAG